MFSLSFWKLFGYQLFFKRECLINRILKDIFYNNKNR